MAGLSTLQAVATEFVSALVVNLSDHPARPLTLWAPVLMLCSITLMALLLLYVVVALCVALVRQLLCRSKGPSDKFLVIMAPVLCALALAWVSKWTGSDRGRPTYWTDGSLVHAACGPDPKGQNPAPLPETGVPVVQTRAGYRELERHLHLGWPVVLKDLVPAEELQHWTPQALAQGIPDFQMRIQQGYTEQQTTEFTEQFFRDFAAGIEKEVPGGRRVPYLSEGFDIFFESAAYRNHIDQLFRMAILPARASVEYKNDMVGAFVSSADGKVELGSNNSAGETLMVWNALWVGPAGARSGLHADPDPINVLYQVYGKKTVFMFPSSEEDKLYASPKFDAGALVSQVDPYHPDLAAFPKYAEARKEVVQISAGDALFIPAGWFHYTISDTAGISISGRRWSLCEITAFFPSIMWIYLDELGFLGQTTSQWVLYDKLVERISSLLR